MYRTASNAMEFYFKFSKKAMLGLVIAISFDDRDLRQIHSHPLLKSTKELAQCLIEFVRSF